MVYHVCSLNIMTLPHTQFSAHNLIV